jgi:hypothetical protein
MQNNFSPDKSVVTLLAQHYCYVVLASQLTLSLSSDFETWADSDMKTVEDSVQ